ncbi:MAG: L-seryl-tRNA(Sec) selenium transferase [SAR324 cluster bacterium]|nr:L-seryl-tRNA(Sec) selenium transferase [SAR324 cluster bacterium]MED5483534.1 L-seryl-tRNA(Sec) selenium transferase [SAR324 cluster bacterium]MEE3267016.1 L-seryl-tRNA(Sec) selenium transferase [SAR324 cluster bacterium]
MSYQNLPSITECDTFLKEQKLPHGKAVREQVNIVLDQLRTEISNNPHKAVLGANAEILERVAAQVRNQSQTTQRVINATGVVVHTNLGRAPLSESLLRKVLPGMSSYSTLEFDLSTGKRGSRDSKIRKLLRTLSGAEDAMVVNNNAAAVFLMLKALNGNEFENKKPEVIVSRGELVEIGGSFRIPDIMREAGVKLVEVGTTNRCRLADYKQALTENTAALLKVHPSNYEIQGFTEEVSVEKMAQLAHSKGLLCFHDWGSGSFYKFRQRGLSEYSTAEQELSAGPDLLAFSGDKLLGGIQAGVLLGKAEIIQKLRQHALYRALRLDKVTLGLFEATLEAYLDLKTLAENVPTVGLLELTREDIRKKVNDFLKLLKLPDNTAWKCELRETESRTGGGALPELPIESAALILSHPQKSANELQNWFRSQTVPVIVRIHEDQIWLDFRTILPQDNEELLRVLSVLIST